MKHLAIFTIFLSLVVQIGQVQALGPRAKNFSTPEEAIEALGLAASKKNPADLKAIFGAEGSDIISSGDKIADQNKLAQFNEIFRQGYKLEPESENVVVAYLGSEEWPFPVPLTQSADGWHFDAQEGKEEISNRRIGRNELNAISVVRAFVDAQHEYYSQDRDGDGFVEYAQMIVSSPGRKNGLFWPRQPGSAPSPFGPLLAKAEAQNYSIKQNMSPEPYHGYLFRILKGQGPNASGGEKNYFTVGGRMSEGFALIAYPVKWNVSGIMTFMVNQAGVIYEKNLGEQTLKIANAVTHFDPDSSWKELNDE